jgi:protein-S-isoprenylcysteine O-methyltransferase Ste14
MKSLELKVPPPLIALAVALAMWGVSRFTPLIHLPTLARVLTAVAVALAGGAISFAGLLAFRSAKTTVNPMKPESATALVSSGVCRFTRNPMYVGLLLVLIGWAIFLSSAWALFGPLSFIVYIGRFQSTPEERVLAGMFGAEYAEYQTRVRRWL